MNHSAIHKGAAIVISVLVLISTLSFSVSMHYCGDHLVDSALFSESKKCGGLDAEIEVYVKKPCCQDVIVLIEGQDDLTKADSQMSTPSSDHFFITCNGYISALFEGIPKQVISLQTYVPPNIIHDLQVLNATFLI